MVDLIAGLREVRQLYIENKPAQVGAHRHVPRLCGPNNRNFSVTAPAQQIMYGTTAYVRASRSI